MGNKGLTMVWELQRVNRVPRSDEGLSFGVTAWSDRTYHYVREVLFDGGTDWFTVNVWRRKRDK